MYYKNLPEGDLFYVNFKERTSGRCVEVWTNVLRIHILMIIPPLLWVSKPQKGCYCITDDGILVKTADSSFRHA